MKILQVNCVYGNGSTGKIVRDIHHGLQGKGISSRVYYGRGIESSEENTYKICSELYGKLNNLRSRVTGLMYGGCYLSTRKLMGIIRKEQPDIVHLHCINGYFVNIYSLIQWLKEQKIKTVLTLHAEFMHTANCGYALDCEKWRTGCGNCPRLRQETLSLGIDNTALSHKKMKAAFDGFSDNLRVVSVSPWLEQRAKESPILAGKQHCTVLNGMDTGIFCRRETAELRKKHNLSDEKVIFHATASFDNDPQNIKGGYYLLRLAERLAEDNVKIIVAGNYPENLQVPDNVILLGKVVDQQLLAAYYAMADVTVLTSRKETFSMVTAESLCCGTPVVGFEAGAPELIAIGEFSAFSAWSDMDKLEENVRKMLAADLDRDKIAAAAAKKYAKETMCEHYLDIYRTMVDPH